jgi:hypothetical protein
MGLVHDGTAVGTYDLTRGIIEVVGIRTLAVRTCVRHVYRLGYGGEAEFGDRGVVMLVVNCWC